MIYRVFRYFSKCALRRERDSNPRYSCPYTAFRVRPDRPLRHLSRCFPQPKTSRFGTANIDIFSEKRYFRPKKNAFTPIFSIREVIFPIFVEDAGGRCSAPEGHLRGRPALSGHSGTVPGAGRKSAGCREPRCHTRRETADSGGPRCHTRRETVGRDATRGGKRPAKEGHDAVFVARDLYIKETNPGAAILEKPGTATLSPGPQCRKILKTVRFSFS